MPSLASALHTSRPTSAVRISSLFTLDSPRRMNGSEVSDPGSPRSETPPTDSGRLPQGSEPTSGFPLLGGILQLIQDRAARSPTSVAIHWGKERLSYSELDQRANRLGRHLRGSGVDPRGRVMLCLDHSMETLVALLAVWKSGAGAVPVDGSNPHLPLDRLVRQAKPTAFIVRGSLPERVDPLGAAVINLDDVAPALASVSAEPLGIPVDPEAVALQLVGTDGWEPTLGEVTSHVQLVNRLGSLAPKGARVPAGAMPASSPIWTERGIIELLLPLAVGAEVVVLNESRSG